MSKKFSYILEFNAKNGQFVNAMRTNVRQVGNVDRKIHTAQKTAQSAQKTFGKLGSIIGGAFAIGAVVNFIKSSTRAYDVQAKAEQNLLVALKGRSDVQKQLISQAQQLQKKTLFGDEETIKAQALIAAFVKEGDQIERVIPLVQDLATAKNMDLAASADLISKTLGSSTNALARYGIKVEGTVGSTERLESLVTSLNDAFGGQAEAAAKVGTSALTQLENAYGDLLETIGSGGSGVINENARFITALVNAINGSMQRGLEERMADEDLMNKKLKESSKEQLKSWVEGKKEASAIYLKYYKRAVEDENDVERKKWSIKYSQAKEGIGLIEKEIEARKKQVPIITSVTEKINGLKEELAIAQVNAKNTNDLELFVQGQKDVAKLKKEIEELNGYLDAIKPIDATSYQTIETKQVSSVELSSSDKKKNEFDVTPKLNLESFLKQMPHYQKLVDDMNEAQDRMKEKVAAVQGAFQQGFSAIGQSIVSGLDLAESGFEGFIGKLIETATQLIAIMLAQSIASSVAGATQSGAATGPAAVFTTPAFIATAIGGVLAAFAAIPSFEFGGIVPGNSFTGDRMLIRANSGEEILRRDDPRHAANPRSYLSSNSSTQTQVKVMIPTVRLRGKDIYFSFKEYENEIVKRT